MPPSERTRATPGFGDGSTVSGSTKSPPDSSPSGIIKVTRLSGSGFPGVCGAIATANSPQTFWATTGAGQINAIASTKTAKRASRLSSGEHLLQNREEFIDLLLLPNQRRQEAEHDRTCRQGKYAVLLKGSQGRGDALFHFDPDHKAPPANLPDLWTFDRLDASHQLAAELSRPRIEVAVLERL